RWTADSDDEDEASDPDEPEWMHEERERARRIVEGGDRYVAIDRIETNRAYRFMVDFIYTLKNEDMRNRLARAIEGRGGVRPLQQCLCQAWAARQVVCLRARSPVGRGP
ncbi:MAG TPA: UPF0158 family protein, partial [Phycisphaerae bacterium]|nr:UPF0158 family protein [Phycisphaerae bacterium]HOM52079.1 UPF0158 family protein [Phycisphaerae bacterium]HPP27606.1 UPF0158 family protein [Phycisphaerae bacterium]HPU26688.1 UPF0158 family protein [Phycisphaerae bacterium]